MNKTRPASNWPFDMGDSGHRRYSSCVIELLQNCDLPPPTKLYSPNVDNGRRRATLKKARQCDADDESRQNQSLLRALQLSQTRAREAEKKALEASIRTEMLSALFLKDSLRLRAAQQWSMLLEIDISLLMQSAAAEIDEDAVSPTTWRLTLALCLGIAGAGFVFSRCIC